MNKAVPLSNQLFNLNLELIALTSRFDQGVADGKARVIAFAAGMEAVPRQGLSGDG